MHTPDLDREGRRPGRPSLGRRRTLGYATRFAPRAHKLGSCAEEHYTEEDGTYRSGTTKALPAPRRSPTRAKPLVRIDGWEQHRHRAWTLSQSLRRAGIWAESR